MMSAVKIMGIHLSAAGCTVTKANRAGVPESVESIPTREPEPTLAEVEAMIARHAPDKDTLIGVACGDPLDWRKGIIQSPPNMPTWDQVPVVQRLEDRFGCKAYLMNDANAAALAEWKFGAGKGCRNLIYLTASMGMGAGLILDGRLYEGTTGSAGEVGHIRLAQEGPVGYGKSGSFEGFCSGNGIVQLARAWAHEQDGQVAFNPGSIEQITLQDVGNAALAGDGVAREIFQTAGRRLGQALAILVDLLNPERIVLGRLYGRYRPLLEPAMREAVEKEALPRPLGVCEIVPSSLGEAIGEYAALSVAPYRAGLWND